MTQKDFKRQEKIKKKKTFLISKQIWILWLVPILINLPGVHAQDLPQTDPPQALNSPHMENTLNNIEIRPPLKPAQEASYEPGVMLIKFMEDSAMGPAARDVFEKKTSALVNAPPDPVLEALVQKYEVITVASLDNAPLSAEDVKKRFPGRSRRIPAGYKPPLAGYTYKVEFQDKSLDIHAICAEFEKSPQVEYAQPNYVVTTQHSSQKG